MLVFIFTALLGETNETGGYELIPTWTRSYLGSDFYQTAFTNVGDIQCAKQFNSYNQPCKCMKCGSATTEIDYSSGQPKHGNQFKCGASSAFCSSTKGVMTETNTCYSSDPTQTCDCKTRKTVAPAEPTSDD